jgi:hypothetical protein
MTFKILKNFLDHFLVFCLYEMMVSQENRSVVQCHLASLLDGIALGIGHVGV